MAMSGAPTEATPSAQDPHRLGTDDHRDGGTERRWRVLGLLSVAQFMLILDVTVVALALPQMGAELGLDRASLTWVMSAYTLTFGGLLLLGGRSADLFGSRVVVLTGLSMFTVASLVTGLASGAGMLIGGRVAQGLAAALLSPAALSVVVKTFDGEERNKALGVWSALGGAGSAAGVLLGGVLTAGPGWQWVFFVNVPIGAAVLAALGAFLPHDRPAAGRRSLDIPGALLVTVATAAAVYGVIIAGERGMFSPSTLIPMAAALAFYAAFVIRQRAASTPLMDLSILVRRSVAAGTVLILVATAITISVFFLSTFYFQQYRQFNPLVTGLLFLPVAAATIIGAQVAGRQIGVRGARVVAGVGLGVTALGAAVATLAGSTLALEVGITVAALGLGAVFVASSVTALASVPHHEAGIASGLLSTFHEFGAAFGAAISSSVAAASITGTDADGFVWGFGVAAAVAVATGLLSLVVVPKFGGRQANSPSAQSPQDGQVGLGA
jgi:EmrB/QacA subfamily drug resistance transporter